MKIGIFLPILSVSDFGYQYNADISIRSLSNFADKVYCRLNSPINEELLAYKNKYGNIILISNKYTQSIDKNGNLVYNLEKNKIGTRYVLDQMRKDGIDLALNIHINQYIPVQAFELLRKQCQYILDNQKPYGWLYKRYQLNDKLFHTDIRVPWILNLKNPKKLYYTPDSISDDIEKEIAHIQTGDYRKYNYKAIVDSQFELTINDQRGKVNFSKNNSELNRVKGIKAKDYFDEEEYIKWYQSKVDKKIISNDQLDIYGRTVAENNQPDFISCSLLEKYTPPNIFRKLYRSIQAIAQGV